MQATQVQLAARWADMQGARAAWIVPARDVADVIAKIGLIGPGDRLVVFSDDREESFRERFRWQSIAFVDESSPEALLRASVVDGNPDVAVEEPRSYAHPAGMSSGRLFWLVPSIGGIGLRVPDMRALARAALSAGAILMVDNTLPSTFGCHPLELGACVSFESLDRVCAGALSMGAVAVACAPCARGRGGRRIVNPVAEDAFRLISFGLGDPASRPSEARALSGADLAAVCSGLDDLGERMQAHFDAARAVAEYLSCHPAVGLVRYPGTEAHPDHVVASSVLRHGFGPAVDFTLTGAPGEGPRARHARFLESCPCANRSDRPGGSRPRMGLAVHGDACYLRIFAGCDDPLAVVDSLDQALRLFCNPPEP